MDFNLWKQLLHETVHWQEFSDDYAWDLFQRTSIAWAMDNQYYFQGVERVNLTELFEQYKILAMLKGTYHGSQIDPENC